MEISAALTEDLRKLTTALDQPGVDLSDLVEQLAVSVTAAVDSFVGLSMVLVHNAHPFGLNVLRSAASWELARTSARLELAALSTAEPGSSIVFYAATPGALTDLVADLGYALGLPAAAMSIDENLPAHPRTGGGLTDMSTLNQAIGVLLAQGHDPGSARRELRRLAGLAGSSQAVAAQRLLGELGPDRYRPSDAPPG
ncbi:MAG: hypothetical protein JWO63_1666 [Frankiales bacterium]|nr:hypothetical protein [Frankiales bacterium]